MKVYVVIGQNNLVNAVGPIGVGSSKELAEKIARENESILDEYKIFELEVRED